MASRPPAAQRVSPWAPPAGSWRRWDLRPFAVTAAVSLTSMVAITAILSIKDVYSAGVRDPLSVAREGDVMPFFTGWGTYAGAVGWFTSAAFALMAWRLRLGHGERRTTALLLGFAGLSALLGADDLFMLHDGFPKLLGVPEPVTTSVMVLLAATWGLVFARDLLGDADGLIIGLAAALFAISVACDVISDLAGTSVLLEESAKFAAIVCWTAWAWRRSVRAAAALATTGAPSA